MHRWIKAPMATCDGASQRPSLRDQGAGGAWHPPTGEFTTFSFATAHRLIVGTSRIVTLQRRLACQAELELPVVARPMSVDIPPMQQTMLWHKYRTNDQELVWLRKTIQQAVREMDADSRAAKLWQQRPARTPLAGSLKTPYCMLRLPVPARTKVVTYNTGCIDSGVLFRQFPDLEPRLHLPQCNTPWDRTSETPYTVRLTDVEPTLGQHVVGNARVATDIHASQALQPSQLVRTGRPAIHGKTPTSWHCNWLHYQP